MARASNAAVIRLRGVRQNNLKNFDLDLRAGRLVVVTGLSGSGKSSLAFDTLFAEGQRRYLETFSPYARQFFDRMDKPAVDSIEGIPPAIAIEQRNTVRTTRSTVGTLTEICDHLKLLWPRLARLHCRGCGRPVSQEPPAEIWRIASEAAAGREALVTFTVPLSDKLPLGESLELVARQGYQRLLAGNRVVRLEEAPAHFAPAPPSALIIVQDRLRIGPGARARFIEACEQAYHFGKGRLSVRLVNGDAGQAEQELPFSARLHCAACDLEYREPTPALFSFNHPLGACPACRGFGRIITVDYRLALPDQSKTLAEGVVKPWQSGLSAECQDDLLKFCRKRGVPVDVPFRDLDPRWQQWVVEGDPGYGQDAEHQWPRCWYGVKGYFRWLESKTYKMHVRVLLSRYRAYVPCPDCHGARLQPEALLYRLENVRPGLTLADFYRLPIAEALSVLDRLRESSGAMGKALAVVLDEARARLSYLVEAGLSYLTLDRPTRTLSGGETERVNLASCLGTRLVNTLFVLDEPSVGLHARDTARLVKILQRLRDAGNTVVVVEHEAAVIRAADEIVDLGPGHGETGGYLVFHGRLADLLKAGRSLTGQYLSGRKAMPPSRLRPVDTETPRLRLSQVTRHNLRDLSVEIPLGRLVGVTGVSGSGKTTLVREVLWPLLLEKLPSPGEAGAGEAEAAEDAGENMPEAAGEKSGARLEGAEQVGGVLLVDQSPLGRTPRSNPAVYLGAFGDIRQVFAQSEPARQRGLNESAFSFNSPQGQCERCRGAGFEKIEMQFLSDVFIRCPDCQGRRYREHLLAVRLSPPGKPGLAWNIADLLAATVDEAADFLTGFDSRAARRAAKALEVLREVGLGYLRLGQPLNTLSGGECQRLKLARCLAEFSRSTGGAESRRLFLFDEPTTGLHFEDVRVLLEVFQRLVDQGHSVVVIEHNLEVIQSADWLIDLGPEGGEDGGRIVVCGPPDRVAACPLSRTGAALAARARRPKG